MQIHRTCVAQHMQAPTACATNLWDGWEKTSAGSLPLIDCLLCLWLCPLLEMRTVERWMLTSICFLSWNYVVWCPWLLHHRGLWPNLPSWLCAKLESECSWGPRFCHPCPDGRSWNGFTWCSYTHLMVLTECCNDYNKNQDVSMKIFVNMLHV